MPKIRRKTIPIGRSSTGIIIPRVLCEMLDIARGDWIEISIVGKQIILKKVENR